uniref:Uncharacterized protein n=1 Tax=Anopheles darlingi TaxID=43151 RepID=A0A2M4DKW9_ANODA
MLGGRVGLLFCIITGHVYSLFYFRIDSKTRHAVFLVYWPMLLLAFHIAIKRSARKTFSHHRTRRTLGTTWHFHQRLGRAKSRRS